MNEQTLGLPRFNVAPFQLVPCLRVGTAGRALTSARWGFVPPWAESDSGARPINARGETVCDKPMFRDSFRNGRCLLPASGFYEWRRRGGARDAYYFRPADGPMMMAGIWSRNRRLELATVAIVTVAATRDMDGIHDRMPLILSEEEQETWLHGDSGMAASMIFHRPEGVLTRHRVTDRVNAARYDDPTLIEPVPDREPPAELAF